MTPGKQDDAESDLGELSFEQALNRLEGTVRALEGGGLNLADATRMFEEGMRLARVCSEMLATAELRISRIKTAYGEQMRMLADQVEGQQVEGQQEEEPC